MNAQDPVELVIGQCWAAFGQGSGVIRVSRSAVGMTRELFLPLIAERLGEWHVEGSAVLEMFRTVGRLAGQLASAQGSPTIRAAHLREALERVRVYQLEQGRGATPYCFAAAGHPLGPKS